MSDYCKWRALVQNTLLDICFCLLNDGAAAIVDSAKLTGLEPLDIDRSASLVAADTDAACVPFQRCVLNRQPRRHRGLPVPDNQNIAARPGAFDDIALYPPYQA